MGWNLYINKENTVLRCFPVFLCPSVYYVWVWSLPPPTWLPALLCLHTCPSAAGSPSPEFQWPPAHRWFSWYSASLLELDLSAGRFCSVRRSVQRQDTSFPLGWQYPWSLGSAGGLMTTTIRNICLFSQFYILSRFYLSVNTSLPP